MVNKKQMITELRHLAPLRSLSDWNKSSIKEIRMLYNKHQNYITIKITQNELLAIRGTLRILLEDSSQGIANRGDLENMIKCLGGNI